MYRIWSFSVQFICFCYFVDTNFIEIMYFQTSFIDSRGTDPSVVYLRSHHVIQDFFLLLPENLSTLRYLIKIFGWFDTSFWTVLLFLYINDFFRPFSFSVPIIEIIIERPVLLILSFFVRSSLCHFVIESFCHTVSPLVHFPWTITNVFLYFFYKLF